MQLPFLIGLGLLLAGVQANDCQQVYVRMDVGQPTIAKYTLQTAAAHVQQVVNSLLGQGCIESKDVPHYDSCYRAVENDGSNVYRCGFRLWRVKKSCLPGDLTGQLNSAFMGNGPWSEAPNWAVWDTQPTGDVHCASQ